MALWYPSVQTMISEVYRVMLDARPLGPASPTDVAEHGVISVAIKAADAPSAQKRAMAMLPAVGWLPLGAAVRTTNLTRLLGESSEDTRDTAYADYARHWLQVAHDEALKQPAMYLLSVDYEYLDHPRRLQFPPAVGSNP